MAPTSSVYVDSCCFIDIVKFDASAALEQGREKEVWYLKKILQAHRDRELTVYTSVLSIAECQHIGENPVPKDIQYKFDNLLTSGQYVHLVQVDPFICTDARDLRWHNSVMLRGADSIHLSSALHRGCSEFIGFDLRFERIAAYTDFLKARGLAIRKPSETEALPGKYLQTDMLDDQTTH